MVRVRIRVRVHTYLGTNANATIQPWLTSTSLYTPTLDANTTILVRMVWSDAVRRGVEWRTKTFEWFSVVLRGMSGAAWCNVVWCDVVWFSVV